MNCQDCQTELLGAADPRWPPPEVSEHLGGCPACQEWLRRLLVIETNVPRVPVPPSRTREDFVSRLRGGASPAAAASGRGTLPLYRRWRVPALAAAGLAAAAVLVACGIFLGNYLAESLQPGGEAPVAKAPGPRPTAGETGRKAPPTQPEEKNGPPEAPPSPLLARLLACDLSLAEAGAAPQRLEALASLADQLQGETRSLAQDAGAEDLKTLARLYEKVIRQGIVARAEGLPADQRRAVLGPIATRLTRTRRDLRALADRSGPGPSEPLLQIAAAADTGSRRLRELMREETP